MSLGNLPTDTVRLIFDFRSVTRWSFWVVLYLGVGETGKETGEMEVGTTDGIMSPSRDEYQDGVPELCMIRKTELEKRGFTNVPNLGLETPGDGYIVEESLG